MPWPGAGPRHLAFHPDGRRLYAVNELDNTVAWYDVDALTGRLTALGEPVKVAKPSAIAIIP